MLYEERTRAKKHKDTNYKLKKGIYREDTCGNRNIPTGSEVIGTVVGGNGNIITTFFKFKGQLQKVGDWKNEPVKATTQEEIQQYLGVVSVQENKKSEAEVAVKPVKIYVKPEDNYTKGKYYITK